MRKIKLTDETKNLMGLSATKNDASILPSPFNGQPQYKWIDPTSLPKLVKVWGNAIGLIPRRLKEIHDGRFDSDYDYDRHHENTLDVISDFFRYTYDRGFNTSYIQQWKERAEKAADAAYTRAGIDGIESYINRQFKPECDYYLEGLKRLAKALGQENETELPADFKWVEGKDIDSLVRYTGYMIDYLKSGIDSWRKRSRDQALRMPHPIGLWANIKMNLEGHANFDKAFVTKLYKKYADRIRDMFSLDALEVLKSDALPELEAMQRLFKAQDTN